MSELVELQTKVSLAEAAYLAVDKEKKASILAIATRYEETFYAYVAAKKELEDCEKEVKDD